MATYIGTQGTIAPITETYAKYLKIPKLTLA
jgi:hypothetical protein